MFNSCHVAIIPQDDGTYGLYVPASNSFRAGFTNQEDIITYAKAQLKNAIAECLEQHGLLFMIMSRHHARKEIKAFIERNEIPASKVLILILQFSKFEEESARVLLSIPFRVMDFLDENFESRSYTISTLLFETIKARQAWYNIPKNKAQEDGLSGNNLLARRRLPFRFF